MTSTVTQAADPSLPQSELDAPGIRRRRSGRGFRYFISYGDTVAPRLDPPEAEQAPPGSANLQDR